MLWFAVWPQLRPPLGLSTVRGTATAPTVTVTHGLGRDYTVRGAQLSTLTRRDAATVTVATAVDGDTVIKRLVQ